MTSLVSDLLLDTKHRASPAIGVFDAWKQWLTLERKSARTIDAYERPVAKLLRENLDKRVEDFSNLDVIAQLSAYPDRSRRPMRVRIGSFFSFAVLQGFIDRNPMDRVPKVKRQQKRVPQTFSPAEMALLMGQPIRDGALYGLLFDGGLRKGEARMLQRKHVSLDRGELIVYRGKGDKDRVVPITHRALALVAELDLVEGLNPDDHLWYGKPGGRQMISRGPKPVGDARMQRWHIECLKTCGIPYRPRTKLDDGLHNLHETRHTYATRFLRAGGRLERLSLLMGHASVQVTFDLYAHLDVEDIRADVALLEGVS